MENTNLMDLKVLANKIANFSHAYLFNVPSVQNSIDDAKYFAQSIMCEKFKKNGECNCEICESIKNGVNDDLYILNPKTVSILKDDILNLMNYFNNKSLNKIGKRVYIICGFERLDERLSNKILKFLEEPEENIHAILLTENMDKILSTIKSRCQIYNIQGVEKKINDEVYEKASQLYDFIEKNKIKTIPYTKYLIEKELNSREEIDKIFENLQIIINNNIKRSCNIEELNVLIKKLEITTQIRKKIKYNLNINLLVDRYIIEMSEV